MWSWSWPLTTAELATSAIASRSKRATASISSASPSFSVDARAPKQRCGVELGSAPRRLQEWVLVPVILRVGARIVSSDELATAGRRCRAPRRRKDRPARHGKGIPVGLKSTTQARGRPASTIRVRRPSPIAKVANAVDTVRVATAKRIHTVFMPRVTASPFASLSPLRTPSALA